MNVKKTKFLQALLTEPTLSAAAEKVPISRTTAYAYLEDPEFEAELTRRKTESVEDALRYLQGKLSMCSAVLIDIIQNPDVANQVKLNAIQLVFNQVKAMTETAEVMRMAPQVEQLAKWLEMQESEDS